MALMNRAVWNLALWNGPPVTQVLASPLQRMQLRAALIENLLLAAALIENLTLARAWTSAVNMAKPKTINFADYRSGDAFGMDVTITSWPVAETAAKIYVTVKRRVTDADADAIFQKEITASASADGVITTTGSSGTVTALVTVSKTESALIEPQRTYYYDVRVITADGDPWTPFDGTLYFKDTATDATT